MEPDGIAEGRPGFVVASDLTAGSVRQDVLAELLDRVDTRFDIVVRSGHDQLIDGDIHKFADAPAQPIPGQGADVGDFRGLQPVTPLRARPTSSRKTSNSSIALRIASSVSRGAVPVVRTPDGSICTGLQPLPRTATRRRARRPFPLSITVDAGAEPDRFDDHSAIGENPSLVAKFGVRKHAAQCLESFVEVGSARVVVDAENGEFRAQVTGPATRPILPFDNRSTVAICRAANSGFRYGNTSRCVMSRIRVITAAQNASTERIEACVTATFPPLARGCRVIPSLRQL